MGGNAACLNHEFVLRGFVNSAFTLVVILLLPILLAATPPSELPLQARRPAVELATATVRILSAERVGPLPAQNPRPDRQVRMREKRILLEFH
jgi:hypothetical protein